MSVSAQTLRKIAALNLSAEQVAGVLDILADGIEAEENRKAAQRERTRKHREKRDCNVTKTLQKRDGNSDAPRGRDTRVYNNPSTKGINNNIKTYPTDSQKETDIRQAVEFWNETAERFNLPKVRNLSEPRRRKLAACLKTNGLDGWCEALTAVERSKHLQGGNDRGWRADFDFFLQDKSFNRAIEGSYDSRECGTGPPRNPLLEALDRAIPGETP